MTGTVQLKLKNKKAICIIYEAMQYRQATCNVNVM